MTEEQLAVWRGANVGIVFQFFQLPPTLTALENAALPLDFARWRSGRERFERARRNLALVGLHADAGHGGVFQFHEDFVKRALEFL